MGWSKGNFATEEINYLKNGGNKLLKYSENNDRRDKRKYHLLSIH